MKLPGGEHSVVELEKLRNYCLQERHTRGRHKARVFAARLGITAKEAEVLRGALIRAAKEEEATFGERDDYGQRYVVDFQMTGPGGSGMVRSVWIVLAGETRPRLVTCYVL
jgi:uncharacterized protein DUF6883